MIPIMPFIAVAAGGALGAVSRFAAYKTIETGFPWATFFVNIVGCIAASFLMFKFGIYAEEVTKTFIFVGFFGAFTTMSTFSIDTINLITDGAYWKAGANVVMNSVFCVAGAAAGRYLALL